MRCLTVAHLKYLILAVVLGWAGFAQAGAALREADELEKSLKLEPPCCVIDARSVDNQRTLPLTEVLRYRPGLSIAPTATVVVVGDNDNAALAIAETIYKQHPGKTIYAVKGGGAIWKTVQHTLDRAIPFAAGGAPAGLSFVIPHNTCETGTPLQILRSSPVKKP